MKQKRKVKSQESAWDVDNKIMASLLVLLGGVFCFGAMSLFTTPNVSGETPSSQTEVSRLYYTGIDNKTEAVYRMYFVEEGNQDAVVNEMYKDNAGDFYISGGSIVFVDYLQYGANNNAINWNEANSVGTGMYTNIFGGNNNEVDSSNITIIGGESNSISGGNDNATVFGSKGSTVFEGEGKVPLVLVGGENNQIKANQEGVAIVGGRNNTIGENVVNSQILGGENNIVEANNATVAGAGVSNASGADSFVFSDGRAFSPQTPNSFYLNVKNGLGLNMQAANGGVSSKGIVSVGEVTVDMCKSRNNVGLQGVLSGCLVGCTFYSLGHERKLELLDTSEGCLVAFGKDNEIVVTPPAEPGYCYNGAVDTSNATICGDPKPYVNTIFVTKLIDANRDTGILCPKVDNQCIYQCNDGWHLVNGKCYKDCELDGQRIHHGQSATWYDTDGTTCTDTCTKNNHSKTLECNDGKLNEGSYKHASCSLSKFRCDLGEYNLKESQIDTNRGHYSSCTDYDPVGNYQCNPVNEVHYKLDYCYDNYTREGDQCYEKCDFNSSHDVDHRSPKTFWYSSSETCTDTCSSVLKVCNDGSWIGNESYTRKSCTLYDKTCESYTISQSEYEQGVAAGKNYKPCDKYSAQGSTKCNPGDTVYKEDGCAAGYFQCNDGRCHAGCTGDTYEDAASCNCVNNPVDGVCDESEANRCAPGTLTGVSETDTQYIWYCEGLYNGNPSGQCSFDKPIPGTDGVCGTSEFGDCKVGDYEYVDSETWRCVSDNGGDSATCQAIDGKCIDDVTPYCTCEIGKPSGCNPEDPNNYTWYCEGIHEGAADSCIYSKGEIPSCGSATLTPSLSSPDPSTLCSAGDASTPAEDLWDGMSERPIWKWTCGNSVECFTYIPTAFINAESCGSDWTINFGTDPYSAHGFDGIGMNVSIQYKCNDGGRVMSDTVNIDYYGDNGGIWQNPNPLLGACDYNANYTILSAVINSVSPNEKNGYRLIPGSACGSAPEPQCGSANGGTYTSAPTTNLCNLGSASSVKEQNGKYSWSCSIGNDQTSCSATKKEEAQPKCGSAHERSFGNTPSTNLCSVGSNSTVSTWTSDGKYSWTCKNGNNTVSCYACFNERTPNNGSCIRPSGGCTASQEEINRCEGGGQTGVRGQWSHQSCSCDCPDGQQVTSDGDCPEPDGTSSDDDSDGCSGGDIEVSLGSVQYYQDTLGYSCSCTNYSCCCSEPGNGGGYLMPSSKDPVYTDPTSPVDGGGSSDVPTTNPGNQGFSCFLAGTQVYMADGTTKNIEDVEVGDMVLTYNIDSGKLENHKVFHKFIHENSDDELYELTINGDVLKVTEVHRFYIAREGFVGENKNQCTSEYRWIEARDLQVGDQIMMKDGSRATIENIIHHPNYGTLYNLGVEKVHNYFVDKGYLVHNAAKQKSDFVDHTGEPDDPNGQIILL